MGIAVRGGATDVVAADDDGRPLGAIFEGTAEQLAVDAVVARRRMLEFGAKRRPVFAQNEPPEPGREKHDRLDELRSSEEHTSELQSLMRISYAVFCLKKKIKNTTTNTYNNNAEVATN